MSVLGKIICPDCGKERYVKYNPYKYSKDNLKCPRCAKLGNTSGRHEEHNSYKGRGDYLMVWIDKDDFFFPMASKAPSGNYGVIAVHRLVMAQHVGRCLQSWEIVHHKNGSKDDNRLENLELTGTIGEHIKDHSKGYKDGYRRGLTDGRLKQIEELKEEVRRLRNG